MDCSPPGSSVHGDSTSKNTGMGCHALLQRIFLTQGSNPGLPLCRRILYPATTVKKAQPLVDLFGFLRHHKSYLAIELQPFYQVIGEIASFEWYPEQYGLPRCLRGKESACQCRKCGFDPWVRMIPWRRKWQPTLVFLPEKIPWTEETGSYSPWGRKESETIEAT